MDPVLDEGVHFFLNLHGNLIKFNAIGIYSQQIPSKNKISNRQIKFDFEFPVSGLDHRAQESDRSP